jgi:hypothetical protein
MLHERMLTIHERARYGMAFTREQTDELLNASEKFEVAARALADAEHALDEAEASIDALDNHARMLANVLDTAAVILGDSGDGSALADALAIMRDVATSLRLGP